MSCKYNYYKQEENYFPRLYCSIDNGMCIYSKKCQLENKFIPLDNQGECYKMKLEEKKNIPNGSYFVETYRPNKKGFLYLYIETKDGTTEKILTEFTELNQNYVYLKKANGKYKVSLIPFTEKKTYAKRKNQEEN